MKRAFVAALLLFGCSNSTAGSGGSGDSSGGASAADGGGSVGAVTGTTSGGFMSGTSGTTGSATVGSSGSGTTSSSGSSGMSGVLTAGVWDDNLNYDFYTQYAALHQGIEGDPGFTQADRDAAHTQFAARSPHQKIDAALVLDTTGSMGDELSYLTAEFAHITSDLSTRFPNADQRWALILYRDTPDHDPGDEYVVRTFDFTSDPTSFTAELQAQSADNGGDTPESPELGLDAMGQLSWRNDPAVARVAFWVGDAPQHGDRGPGMHQALASAQMGGIHIYPVAGSGADDLLEFTMRNAAQLTGGRYMFLTDDSGVGGSHKAPEIPCYYVTLLEKALVRVAGMEITGSYIGPETTDIIRVDGNPSQNGTCMTQDGQSVQIF